MPRNGEVAEHLSVLSTVLLFRPVVSLVVQDYFLGFAGICRDLQRRGRFWGEGVGLR